MVHSALKRMRSSSDFDDVQLEPPHANHAPLAVQTDVPPEDVPPAIENSDPPAVDKIWKTLHDGLDDPRPTLLVLLSFLSDAELFSLVTYRVAHAAPFGPPLFLTPFCIEGLHNFFIPRRPPAEEVFPTNDLTGDSPFTKIPGLRNEKGQITGKVTGRVTKERAAAMLVSLATLFNFLNSHELRLLIQARARASEAPHDGVRWFLEFMHSGGDAVPRGKLDLERRSAKGRKRTSEGRRMKVGKGKRVASAPRKDDKDARQDGRGSVTDIGLGLKATAPLEDSPFVVEDDGEKAEASPVAETQTSEQLVGEDIPSPSQGELS